MGLRVQVFKCEVSIPELEILDTLYLGIVDPQADSLVQHLCDIEGARLLTGLQEQSRSRVRGYGVLDGFKPKRLGNLGKDGVR